MERSFLKLSDDEIAETERRMFDAIRDKLSECTKFELLAYGAAVCCGSFAVYNLIMLSKGSNRRTRIWNATCSAGVGVGICVVLQIRGRGC